VLQPSEALALTGGSGNAKQAELAESTDGDECVKQILFSFKG